MIPVSRDVTQMLNALAAGDQNAANQLLPLVYQELRRLGAQRLANEPAGQTLQPTALVHEAYIRLVGAQPRQHWDGRGHFFAAAAEAMRRVLIDSARRKKSEKRGGGWQRLDMLDNELAVDSAGDDLFAVDEALSKLAKTEPEMAKLVELRFFAGLTPPHPPGSRRRLNISLRTANRYWTYARAAFANVKSINSKAPNYAARASSPSTWDVHWLHALIFAREAEQVLKTPPQARIAERSRP